MEGIPIKNYGCQIDFVRHAQSLANIGNSNIIDSPLSETGVEQAKKLKGHYDLIICSPLRRTKETLHYSKISYDDIIINYNIREMVQNKSSMLILEQRKKFKPETISNFWQRANIFTQELQKYCLKLSKIKDNPKILIISHGYFFNSWFRRGCHTTPTNAKIINLY